MKKMFIYEPAMCCPTGLCGVSVDPELLRISTIQSNLKNNGIEVVRFNLSNSPLEFMKNVEVNKLLNEGGMDVLPITVVDGEIVKVGGYPSNEELMTFLDVPRSYLGLEPIKGNIVKKKNNDCGCSGKGCC